MLHGIFGNASEINTKDIQQDLDALLVEGETLVRGFRIIRDLFIFTDKRLILIDKQGITGRKAEYHSIPYKSISHFSVETAGTFDMDAEMKIYETDRDPAAEILSALTADAQGPDPELKKP